MEEQRIGKLLHRPDIRLISGLAEDLGTDAWLVGGGLRDLCLAREMNDLDFVLATSWEDLPRFFAHRIGGSFFWLDQERSQARVVLKGDEGQRIYDFAPLGGSSIEDDLALRDFTVNAMAVALRGGNEHLIDPTHGLSDLCGGGIRMCGPASFAGDPLRLMRAVRFAAELGFTIEGGTWHLLCAQATLLAGIAAERIRDELFRTLAAPGCGVSIARLCDSRLWAVISPEELPGDVNAAIARAAGAERLCGKISGLMAKYLEQEVEGGISASALIMLASFLGRGEGAVHRLAERLRLGRAATRMLVQLCSDQGPLLAALESPANPRQLFRFFRDREPAGAGMLIVAMVGGEISAETFSLLLDYFLREYEPGEEDLFLDGGEVMDLLAISPGKAVGEALQRLREAEAQGQVENRDEAVAFVKNLLTTEESMG